MSYTIDIFRRRIEPTRSILEYTTFVSLFPHLIAGPIVRFTDLAGQLRRLTPRLTSRYAALGIFFLSCGLVKKLLIADSTTRTSAACPRTTRTSACLPAWRRGRLFTAALLRLLRLLRHGGRAHLAPRLPLPAELRLAVQGGEHLRLLAALAHEPLLVVPRLPVHPPRRLAPGRVENGAQPVRDDVPGRALARRGLDVRDLGPAARRLPRRARRPAQSRADPAVALAQPHAHVPPRLRPCSSSFARSSLQRRGRHPLARCSASTDSTAPLSSRRSCP